MFSVNLKQLPILCFNFLNCNKIVLQTVKCNFSHILHFQRFVSSVALFKQIHKQSKLRKIWLVSFPSVPQCWCHCLAQPLRSISYWPLFCSLAYLAMFLRYLAVIQNYSTYRDNTLSFVSRVVKNVVTVTEYGCYVRPK